MDELSERDQAVLQFERAWWRFAGAKDAAVRETFDMSSTRYYQVLGAVLEDPAAEAYDAATVRRLKRLRAARRGVRTSGQH